MWAVGEGEDVGGLDGGMGLWRKGRRRERENVRRGMGEEGRGWGEEPGRRDERLMCW